MTVARILWLWHRRLQLAKKTETETEFALSPFVQVHLLRVVHKATTIVPLTFG
jgi:hypothetical protein